MNKSTGGYGIDFANNSDAVDEGVAKVAKGVLAHGVTSFCPTVVTSSSQTYHKVLPKIQRADGGEHGANILGLHLEGPFISEEKKGAHQLQHIQELSQVPLFCSHFSLIIDKCKFIGSNDIKTNLRVIRKCINYNFGTGETSSS